LSYHFVTLFISLYFISPIFFVTAWFCVPAIMSMPKATIYKNNNTIVQESKIWLPRKFVVSSPTKNFVLSEKVCQYDFC